MSGTSSPPLPLRATALRCPMRCRPTGKCCGTMQSQLAISSCLVLVAKMVAITRKTALQHCWQQCAAGGSNLLTSTSRIGTSLQIALRTALPRAVLHRNQSRNLHRSRPCCPAAPLLCAAPRPSQCLTRLALASSTWFAQAAPIPSRSVPCLARCLPDALPVPLQGRQSCSAFPASNHL